MLGTCKSPCAKLVSEDCLCAQRVQVRPKARTVCWRAHSHGLRSEARTAATYRFVRRADGTKRDTASSSYLFDEKRSTPNQGSAAETLIQPAHGGCVSRERFGSHGLLYQPPVLRRRRGRKCRLHFLLPRRYERINCRTHFWVHVLQLPRAGQATHTPAYYC